MKCQDCGQAIAGPGAVFCWQCANRHEQLEATKKRRSIVSAIAALVGLIVFLAVFFLLNW
jgi:hypothetical protein